MRDSGSPRVDPPIDSPPERVSTNSVERAELIISAFNASHFALSDSEWAEAVFEHGQWWISATTGAQWSVVDATGGDSIDGFGFEQVSEGEGNDY